MTDFLTVLDAERTLLEAHDRLAEGETLTAMDTPATGHQACAVGGGTKGGTDAEDYHL
jgi:hypothetical protein